MKVIVTAPGELQELLREVISELPACGRHTEERPALLTPAQLAHELGVSVSSLRTLRDRGLPTIRVLDSPRFELDAVLDWLKTDRATQNAPESPTQAGRRVPNRRLRQPKTSNGNARNGRRKRAQSSPNNRPGPSER